MEQRLYEALQSNPIIAAVRDDEGLEACLQADVQTVFVLYGDICGIAGIGRFRETSNSPSDSSCFFNFSNARYSAPSPAGRMART